MAFLQPRLRGSGSLIVTETVTEGSRGSCVWNETSGTECALPRGVGGGKAMPDEELPLGTVASHVTPDDVSITTELLLSPFSVPVPMSWETWCGTKGKMESQLSSPVGTFARAHAGPARTSGIAVQQEGWASIQNHDRP